MKLARKALVVACLAVATGPVFADAHSTATFGNLKVTLIDLNPNDGIAASISFLPDPRKFYDGAAIKGEAETWLEQGSFEDLHDEKFNKAAAWGSANISGGANTETASVSTGVTASADGPSPPRSPACPSTSAPPSSGRPKPKFSRWPPNLVMTASK